MALSKCWPGSQSSRSSTEFSAQMQPKQPFLLPLLPPLSWGTASSHPLLQPRGHRPTLRTQPPDLVRGFAGWVRADKERILKGNSLDMSDDEP